MDVALRVKRFDPEHDRRPHWVRYELEIEPTDRVLDALHQIKWTIEEVKRAVYTDRI